MNDKSTKLIRFMANHDGVNIFHYDAIERFDSTFTMRSLGYYKSVENQRIRDASELNISQNVSGEVIDREDIQSYYYLVSCWSLYEEIDFDELSKKFIDNSVSGVAIISTIEKVDMLIKEITKKFNQPPYRYKHERVEYYGAEADNDVHENDWFHKVRFMKRDIYKNEYEYRFLFDLIDLEPALINTITFNVKSQDYIDQIIGIRVSNSLLAEYCQERNMKYKNIV